MNYAAILLYLPWVKPLNHYRVFTDKLFGVLLYYILCVQRLWTAPASKGALLNIHYYYYYYYYYYHKQSVFIKKDLWLTRFGLSHHLTSIYDGMFMFI